MKEKGRKGGRERRKEGRRREGRENGREGGRREGRKGKEREKRKGEKGRKEGGIILLEEINQAGLRLFCSEDSRTVYSKTCENWYDQRISYEVKMSFKYKGNRPSQERRSSEFSTWRIFLDKKTKQQFQRMKRLKMKNSGEEG